MQSKMFFNMRAFWEIKLNQDYCQNIFIAVYSNESLFYTFEVFKTILWCPILFLQNEKRGGMLFLVR